MKPIDRCEQQGPLSMFGNSQLIYENLAKMFLERLLIGPTEVQYLFKTLFSRCYTQKPSASLDAHFCLCRSSSLGNICGIDSSRIPVLLTWSLIFSEPKLSSTPNFSYSHVVLLCFEIHEAKADR